MCTHCWFNAETTIGDESPDDADQLRAARTTILEVADLIIPGHGAAFRPTDATPR